MDIFWKGKRNIGWRCHSCPHFQKTKRVPSKYLICAQNSTDTFLCKLLLYLLVVNFWWQNPHYLIVTLPNLLMLTLQPYSCILWKYYPSPQLFWGWTCWCKAYDPAVIPAINHTAVTVRPHQAAQKSCREAAPLFKFNYHSLWIFRC